jgi:hypothetical protein
LTYEETTEVIYSCWADILVGHLLRSINLCEQHIFLLLCEICIKEKQSSNNDFFVGFHYIPFIQEHFTCCPLFLQITTLFWYPTGNRPSLKICHFIADVRMTMKSFLRMSFHSILFVWNVKVEQIRCTLNEYVRRQVEKWIEQLEKSSYLP